MGQVIFIGFFAAAAICLAVLGYFTGRYDALMEIEEREEEEDEQEKIKEEREAYLTDNIRRYYRRHKHIDYDLRREYARVRKAGSDTDY